MGWQRQEQLEARAERRTAKQQMMLRDHLREAPSRYRERVAERRRGMPMASRSGEQVPWWLRQPGIISVEA